MARKFSYDNRLFDDPDPAMTTEEVRQSMTAFFPELANASTKETKNGEDTVFTFERRVGTKG